LLHDPREQPMMLESGFRVSPGFVTQNSVTAQYVRKLAIPVLLNINQAYRLGIFTVFEQ